MLKIFGKRKQKNNIELENLINSNYTLFLNLLEDQKTIILEIGKKLNVLIEEKKIPDKDKILINKISLDTGFDKLIVYEIFKSFIKLASDNDFYLGEIIKEDVLDSSIKCNKCDKVLELGQYYVLDNKQFCLSHLGDKKTNNLNFENVKTDKTKKSKTKNFKPKTKDVNII